LCRLNRPQPNARRCAAQKIPVRFVIVWAVTNRSQSKSLHLRRNINLAHLYGREAVIHAITQANHWRTFDAAYIETLVMQDRRRRKLPIPTLVRPRRTELLEETDLEEPDPAVYDYLTTLEEDLAHE
jgi:hypothetical protein